MKITLDLETLVRKNCMTSEEAERLKGLAEPAPVRGLWYAIVPALLGLLIGELIGGLLSLGRPVDRLEGREKDVLEGLLQGGVTGLIVGGALGLVIWVFFPYAGGAPSAAAASTADEKVSAVEPGRCPACGAKITEQDERCPSCSITLR